MPPSRKKSAADLVDKLIAVKDWSRYSRFLSKHGYTWQDGRFLTNDTAGNEPLSECMRSSPNGVIVLFASAKNNRQVSFLLRDTPEDILLWLHSTQEQEPMISIPHMAWWKFWL